MVTYFAFLLITLLALTPPGHWFNWLIAGTASVLGFIEGVITERDRK